MKFSFILSKDSVFACILDEKGEKIFEKRYETLTPNLTELRDMLVEQGCGRAAMESTSIYWMPNRSLAFGNHISSIY